MMNAKKILLGLSLFGLWVGSAFANVSLTNGNFFMGYTDIVYPGGFEPKMERVYNSKTAFKGVYGWGWGTEYEVYLTVSADGSVVVHEYGGGAENRFTPNNFSQEELKKSVDAIVLAAQKSELVGKGDQLEKYKSRLLSDAFFRNQEWEKFKRAGKVKARELPEGTQLVSNQFSFQYITRVKGGYIRTFENGRIEKFGDTGRLVKISDRNNNFIELAYNKNGQLEKIVDNFNRKMFFKFNGQGLIESIEGENGKKATFQYNAQSELVASKDVDANAYRYKYSTDGRHNLIEIGYTDNTKLQVAYYGKDLFESVKSVKDRDGTLTEYKYTFSGANKLNYKVSLTAKDKAGQLLTKANYEYNHKIKGDGQQWLARLVSEVDGNRAETTYHEQSGLPLMINNNGKISKFEYNARGQVIKKDTPTELTELSYDPKVFKVTRVSKISRVDANEKTWSEFQYDDRGNLVLAKNNEGKGVKLLYDKNGRIASMVDNTKRQINFKYNENSKPIEITDPKMGTITVQYTNSGEIKKVESSAGRKVALEVTSAFQNLLDIIRPSGVELSF